MAEYRLRFSALQPFPFHRPLKSSTNVLGRISATKARGSALVAMSPLYRRLISNFDKVSNGTLIRIRRSLHPAWTIPITRSFLAFLPNWWLPRSRTRQSSWLPAAPVLIEIASHSCSQVSTHGNLPVNSSGRCQYGLDRTLTKVLQYVVPHQEVMTHIDVSDDNSTPEQNMVRADRVELPSAS